MSGNPFVGPVPYQTTDHNLFYGRQREIRDISSAIIVNQEVLVFGRSGTGKSSLINAGITYQLEKHHNVYPVNQMVGVSNTDLDTSDDKDPKVSNNPFIHQLQENWILDPTPSTDHNNEQNTQTKSPESTTNRLDVYGKKTGREKEIATKHSSRLRIIIIDQLEHIFTTGTDKDRRGFFEYIGGEILKTPELRVVFVLQEEFLARLDPYVHLMPGHFRTRYRITKLIESQARDAIQKSVESSEYFFGNNDSNYLNKLMSKLVENGRVDTIIMQVVCRKMIDSLPSGVKNIDFDTVTLGDNFIQDALSKFYDEAVSAAAREQTEWSEAKIRNWIEYQMIIQIPGQPSLPHFAPLLESEVKGLPQNIAEKLDEAQILRHEDREGSTWYTLSHRRLIDPILKSNKTFQEKRRKRRDSIIFPAFGLVSIIIVSIAFLAFFILYSQDSTKQQNLHDISVDNFTDIQSIFELYDNDTVFTLDLISQDGVERIITGTTAGNTTVWEMQSGIRIGQTRAREEPENAFNILVAKFHPDNSNIIFEGNPVTGLQSFHIDINQEPTLQVAVDLTPDRVDRELSWGHIEFAGDPSNRIMVAATITNPVIRVWDVSLNEIGDFNPSESTQLTLPEDLGGITTSSRIVDIAISPNGEYIAAAIQVNPDNHKIVFWENDNEDALAFTPSGIGANHENRIRNIVFVGKDGNYTLISGSNDASIRFWDPGTGGERVDPITDFDCGISAIAVSSDEAVLATATFRCPGLDTHLRFWDIADIDNGTIEELHSDREFTYAGDPFSIAFHPDDNRIVATSSLELFGINDVGTLHIWDRTTGESIRLADSNFFVVDILFNPEGTALVSAGGLQGLGEVWGIGCVVQSIINGNVNIRSESSLDSNKVGELSLWQTSLAVTGPISSDDRDWWQLPTTEKGQQRYVVTDAMQTLGTYCES